MANYDLAFPGAAIDAILTTAYDLQNAGYIFKGSATAYSGTPTQRTWLLAPAGFSGYGFSSAIPKGSIGICKWNGNAWSGDVINVVTIDNYPTYGSTNAVTSGGMWNALDDLGDGIWATLQSFVIQDGTASANQGTQIKFDVKMTDGQQVQHLISSFGILAATTTKAGLMSAADKAKVDAFLDNMRSLSFTDTTPGADVGTKIVETLKMTVDGVQEAVTALTILAATTSKAGLMSATDKAYIDGLPTSLSTINTSISKLLAMLGYYECSTAAATAAKEVSASGYVLTNGGCIRIKMNNANTAANVTLNINSTGAKALYYDGAQASATNTWEAGEVLEVYYDGTQYQCASGGGGKFATGEKVKETSITDEITPNSDALPTSDAVNTAIRDIDLANKGIGTKDVFLRFNLNYSCTLNSNGTYSGNTSYALRTEVPAVPNAVYTIIGNSTYDSQCAFLTQSDSSISSGTASLTSDGRTYLIPAGQTISILAPADARFLVVNVNAGNTSSNSHIIRPSAIKRSYLFGEWESEVNDSLTYSTNTSSVDLSTIITKSYNFNSNGKYSVKSSSQNYWLKVTAGHSYTVTAGETAINIGFLKSNSNPVVNQYADLSIYNGTVQVIPAGESLTLTAPLDAVNMIMSAIPASISERYNTLIKEETEKQSNNITDIYERLSELVVPMNPIAIPSTNYSYWFNGSGNYSGNSASRHVYIPVQPNHTYKIIGGEVGNYAAFLTQSDGNPTVNTHASITSDGKVYVIATEAEVEMVAPADARFIVFNTSNGSSSICVSAFGEVLSLEDYLLAEHDPQSIFDFNPSWVYGNLLLQANRNLNLNNSGTSGVKPLVLLHCSDVHSDKKSWDRMIQFYTKYSEYIAGAICTGDLVGNTINDDKTYLQNGAASVMLALGNHDVAKTNWNVYDATAEECYNAFFAPYIENWGVTRPDGATYECYYYKDYPTQKIRLIVLDTNTGANGNNQHWNATQLAWLQTTLESARTAGYSVVIAQHYWAVNASGRTYVDCTFTCKTPLSEGESIIPADARTAVQSFIDAGGNFICWISGHTHRDFVYYPTANPKQLGIVVDCTAGFVNAKNVCDEAREAGTKSIDAFNIISFDTTRKVIKIVRIGSDTDSLMRHKGVLSIQYGGETPEVIFNN